MRYIHQFCRILALFTFCTFAVAQESDQLIALLSPIHSMQGQFVQTVLDNQGKAVQRSQGTISLKRPGQFRWEIKQPIPQVIVADNTRMWIYDPDLQQVVIRPMAKTLGQTPAFLLTNVSDAINQDFTVRSMPSSAHWQWFSLTPKDKNSMFQHIQLGFLDRAIKEMRMQDNLGHSTVIEFKNVKENIELASTLFSFKPPANVDVIDETHPSH